MKKFSKPLKILLVIISGCFLLLFLLTGISLLFDRDPTSAAFSFAICITLAFLICKLMAKKSRPAKDYHSIPDAPPKSPSGENISSDKPSDASSLDTSSSYTDPMYENIGFRVVGVTYKNGDGISRQDILRNLIKTSIANGYTDYDVSVVPSTFDGKPSLEVYINNQLVGFIASDDIDNATAVMSRAVSCDAIVQAGGKDFYELSQLNEESMDNEFYDEDERRDMKELYSWSLDATCSCIIAFRVPKK